MLFKQFVYLAEKNATMRVCPETRVHPFNFIFFLHVELLLLFIFLIKKQIIYILIHYLVFIIIIIIIRIIYITSWKKT